VSRKLGQRTSLALLQQPTLNYHVNVCDAGLQPAAACPPRPGRPRRAPASSHGLGSQQLGAQHRANDDFLVALPLRLSPDEARPQGVTPCGCPSHTGTGCPALALLQNVHAGPRPVVADAPERRGAGKANLDAIGREPPPLGRSGLHSACWAVLALLSLSVSAALVARREAGAPVVMQPILASWILQSCRLPSSSSRKPTEGGATWEPSGRPRQPMRMQLVIQPAPIWPQRLLEGTALLGPQNRPQQWCRRRTPAAERHGVKTRPAQQSTELSPTLCLHPAAAPRQDQLVQNCDAGIRQPRATGR